MSSKIVLLFFFLTICFKGFSQTEKNDSSLFIQVLDSGFYAKGPNVFAAYSPMYSMNTLVIKTSQGIVENIDNNVNNFFSLTNLNVGKVIISAYSRVDTGLILIKEQVFNVTERTLTESENLISKFKITISNFTDSIPSYILNNATKVEVNPPFKIKYATLIVYKIKVKSNPHLVYDPKVFPLETGKFDDNTKKMLAQIKPENDFMILLSDIQVIDSEGKVYELDPIFFKII